MDFSLFVFGLGGHTQQCLGITLHSTQKLFLAVLGGPYEMQGIEPGVDYD